MDEEPTRDRAHDALDFYHKTSPYKHKRESLVDLRKMERKYLRSGRSTEEKEPTRHKHHLHELRCGECLHLKDECICEVTAEKAHKSDWRILTQRTLEPPRHFVEKRLDWLEKLEKSSRVKRRDLVEKKFDKQREVCCCPFNTFRIYAKQDIADADFYTKNP